MAQINNPSYSMIQGGIARMDVERYISDLLV